MSAPTITAYGNIDGGGESLFVVYDPASAPDVERVVLYHYCGLIEERRVPRGVDAYFHLPPGTWRHVPGRVLALCFLEVREVDVSGLPG